MSKYVNQAWLRLVHISAKSQSAMLQILMSGN